MLKRAEKGRVYLVGGGPGDPDLLTVRAAALIQSADLLFHDDLVAPEILKLANKQATIQNVGKRCGSKSITQEGINALLIRHARAGHSVVRLKIGDPMLFGRAGEEIDALHHASVPFEVVPGITAAFAAAATIHASLTDRRLASKVVFLTGHRASPEDPGWGPLPTDATLVIYMPGSDYARLSAQIRASGFGPETPSIIISKVATAKEQTRHTTVGNLASGSPLSAPCVILVGNALGRRKS
ncbi:uroporphyrinogen-III C-methyltransferase [Alloacidobacterium dinghuense]|uniref:uroporphyrinogen-III C-methyltransferase n=1 Tax=Alloacidobacterium dinghuense TaxID=2763107 RepID=A0A7G8BKE7_9BACT|nr:uroporphyrinogen-III C-methyltransferase [Alloacidobacterium dinghuense]QNI33017.1 uroporphyrinogen-III C-methyltransferase [Alloacidobacterium dinghuense]